jgi:hypothetical protein
MEPADADADRPEQPVTPHATPILDADGRLTYVGNDGRRYVVGLSPELDEQSVERVMAALRQGSGLFQQIEVLCHRWIAAVSGGELEPRAALVLLLTTLETALEDEYGEEG